MHVVIIGGSFAGLAAAQKLDGHRNLEVTVIEPKPFFEYTPGILRAFVQPTHAEKLMVPLAKAVGGCNLIQGLATDIQLDIPNDSSSSGMVSGVASETGERFSIHFDHLLVCTGSAYNHQIKIPPDQPVCIKSRALQLQQKFMELKNANSVLIVGGGIVGVEFAAEIIQRFPSKNVTVLSKSSSLLPDLPLKAQKRAFHWLKNRGVRVITGDTLRNDRSEALLMGNESPHRVLKTFKTGKGEQVAADLIYHCTGNLLNWGSLEKCSLWSKKPWPGIPVNEMLQVPEHTMINVAGDACTTGIRDLKTAHLAEEHGLFLAETVLEEMRRKPASAVNNKAKRGFLDHLGIHAPSVMVCVSLGKFDGILVFNSMVICGFFGGRLAAFSKWMLEVVIVSRVKRNIVAKLLWNYIASPLTHFTEKYILKASA